MRVHLRIVPCLLVILALAACSDTPDLLDQSGTRAVNGPNLTIVQESCLGDFIWNDENMNGCQDDGEPGIEGVRVSAYRCSDDSFAGDTLSVADGYYALFLEPGEYYIRVDVPDGWTLTDADQSCGSKQLDSDIFPGSGRSACTVLGEGEIKKSFDVGMYGGTPPPKLGCIGDRVWLDENCDGCQGDGEEGVAGIRVELYNCADELLAAQDTDENGNYLFDELEAGDYYVKFILEGDYTFTHQNACGSDEADSDADEETGVTACTTIDAGECDKSWDAGLCRKEPPPKLGCIGDRVWLDENCNGCQDKDEPGIPGIRVDLYNCADEFLATLETDEDGLYCFTDLESGRYYLKFHTEGDYTFTHQDACGNDEIDSDADELTGETVCTTIDAGECDKTWDAGFCMKKEGEGCTPGYWKNHVFAWPEGYEPDDVFDDVFGCTIFGDGTTLYEALWHGGGGIYRLGRHGTAALLSAAHPGVDYGLSVGEVIDAVCKDGDADLLEEHNEMGCPLSGRDPDRDNGPNKQQ